MTMLPHPLATRGCTSPMFPLTIFQVSLGITQPCMVACTLSFHLRAALVLHLVNDTCVSEEHCQLALCRHQA